MLRFRRAEQSYVKYKKREFRMNRYSQRIPRTISIRNGSKNN